MSKITIDIKYVKESLEKIGYIISDFIERDNNGINWQIKFSNSGAIATVYDTNNKKNSVVGGKCEDGEKEALKEIIDGLKCKEITVDAITPEITMLINSGREGSYYDFKERWVEKGKNGDLLHDILCLSNNLESEVAYLIVGVRDDYTVLGVEEWKKSNEIYDWLKGIKFAGEKTPKISLKKVYNKFKKLDVLVVEKTKDVPFFIEEEYKGVHPYHIYSRVGDTNTPKNSQASYNCVEQLWKRHFDDKES